MKKYLIISIAIILSLILMLSPIITKAATNDISITLTSATKNIKAGDEVTVTFTVTDAKKINGLEAELKGNDILKIESVKIDQESDIFHNWATTNDKLEISGNIASETLKVTIKLKVLSTPKEKVSFTIENIEVNEDNTNWTEAAVNMGAKSIEFSPVVEEKPKDDGNGNNNNGNNGGNNNGGDNNGGNNSGGNNNNENNNQNNNNGNNQNQSTDGQSRQRATDPAIVVGGDTSSSGSSNTTSSSSSTATRSTSTSQGNKASTSSSTTSSSSSSSGTSNSNLPQTGDNDILIIGIIATSVIAVVAYVKYRKYQCI